MKNHYSDIFTSMMSQFKQDIILTITMHALMLTTLIILAVSGTAIWPVIVSLVFSSSVSVLLPQLRTILFINVGLLLLCICIQIFSAFLRRPGTLIRQALLSFTLGLLVNFLYLCSQNDVIQSMIQLDFLLTPLWFIISFFLSCILAFLPAVLCTAASQVTLLVHRLTGR